MTPLADAVKPPPRNPPLNRPGEHTTVNITPWERGFAGVLGAGLVGFGVTRRTLPALLAGVAGGGALLAMAATRYCPFYDALRINTARSGTAQPSEYYEESIHVEVTQTIAQTPHEPFRV